MQLRQYQIDAKLAVFDYFSKHKTGNPLVAMPTGTGKSVVIGSLVKDVMQLWPGQRILMLTHVKELIQQNANKLLEIWPDAPIGIYSAGLNKKEKNWPITYAGIASIVKKIKQFGHIDLVLIDEAHLVSDDAGSMYQQVLSELANANSYVRAVGFTATSYRMQMGDLRNGSVFTHLAYDLTSYQAFNSLIQQGYLSPLITKRTATRIDVSRLSVSNGDYNIKQAEELVDKNDLLYHACKEIIEYGYDRPSWLVFVPGVASCEHTAKMLNNLGIATGYVHSKMSAGDRDRTIAAFKADKLRALVNNKVLTTGFDHPGIELIADLAPTMSTGLHVQKFGRGTRPSNDTGKRNCLCLDFCGNVARLGPINDPKIPKQRGEGGDGTPPIRICDQCGLYNHANARVCEFCGYEFPINVGIQQTSYTDELLRTDNPILEWFDVRKTLYMQHESQRGSKSLKVVYVCDKRSFKEYVLLEASSNVRFIALKWWKKRMGTEEAPPTVEEALKWTNYLDKPKRIQVHTNKLPYPEITDFEF